MGAEYRTGGSITPVAIDVAGCTSLPKVKVKGLPSGLKFTAKNVYKKGSKTEVEYPANTIYGTLKKSGVYTVVATVTTAGKKTASSSQTIVVRKDGEKMVKIEVPEIDGVIPGSAKGAGIYAEGKKVTFKATAAKGYVFAGWFDGEGNPVEGAADYRSTSLPYVMGNEDVMFTAKFVSKTDDSRIGFMTVAGNWETDSDGSFELSLSKLIESYSLPKVTVKGLPKGLKFNSKTMEISGVVTKPGVYPVTILIKNATVKKAVEYKINIEVPNHETSNLGVSNLTAANGYFIEGLNNGTGEKYVLSVGISNIEDFLPSLSLKSNVKLAVSGLPEGLKYDVKTGKITGIATKPGIYNVTLTVTDGNQKYVSTITIEVEALPDWVVGTFNGYIDGSESWDGDWVDWVTITITSSGKVTYKDLTEDGSIYTVEAKDITFEMDEDYKYRIVILQEGSDWYSHKHLTIYSHEIVGRVVGVIEGTSEGADIEDGGYKIEPSYGRFYARQNVWETAIGTKLAPEFVKNMTMSVSMDEMRDDEWNSCYGGNLALKFGGNGAVTTAYSEHEGGKAIATGSAQLVPYEVDGNITKAWLYTALKPKGRDSFGVLLFLEIDASNGVVTGDGVYVMDYLLEVDD